MALIFHLDKIEDYEHVCYDVSQGKVKSRKLVTEHLIWSTMVVELGEITLENAAEFWGRLSMMYSIGHTTHITGEGKIVRATALDVVDHIGLYTNVPNVNNRRRWLTHRDGQVIGRLTERIHAASQEVEAMLSRT